MSDFGKHYIVTGGAGFIESSVIRDLIKDSEVRITSIDNFDPFSRQDLKLLNLSELNTHPNFSLLEADLDTITPEQMNQSIPQPVDLIIHLAAKAGVRPSIADPIAYQQTNILGTQKLLDFAVQQKV